MTLPSRMPSRSEKVLHWSTWISVVRNFWWIFATVIAFYGVLVILYSRASSPSWLRVVLVAIATATATIPLGAVLYRYVLRRKETPLGYKWQTATYTFSFDKNDRRRQKQELAVEIEACRDNLTLFGNKYYWTGQGSDPNVTLLSDDQVLLIDPRLTYDGWQYYYVHLKKPLLRGELATIRIEQDFFDENRTFLPTLSKYVREDIGSLTLRVVFSSDMPAQDRISAVVRDSTMGEQNIISRGEFEYDAATGSVKFVVEKPQKGRTYAIEWDWDYSS